MRLKSSMCCGLYASAVAGVAGSVTGRFAEGLAGTVTQGEKDTVERLRVGGSSDMSQAGPPIKARRGVCVLHPRPVSISSLELHSAPHSMRWTMEHVPHCRGGARARTRVPTAGPRVCVALFLSSNREITFARRVHFRQASISSRGPSLAVRDQTKSSSPRRTTFGSEPSVGAAACGHA